MWYAYALYPIDHHWEFLTSLKNVAHEVGSNEALNRVFHGYPYMNEQITVDDLERDWKVAKSLARAVGWEGDITQGPSLFWLPTHSGFEPGFAFKQQNNGMTFIISPLALPWLEKRAAATANSIELV